MKIGPVDGIVTVFPFRVCRVNDVQGVYQQLRMPCQDHLVDFLTKHITGTKTLIKGRHQFTVVRRTLGQDAHIVCRSLSHTVNWHTAAKLQLDNSQPRMVKGI